MARPTEFSPEYLARLRGGFPELKRRALLDRAYAIEVWSFLAPDAKTNRFDWLTDMSGARGGHPRFRIITELGRLYRHGYIDEAEVEKLATDICEHQPRTADCVVWLQSMRETAPKFNAITISATVAKTIEDYYRRCNAELTPDRIEVLLDNVRYFLTGEEEE